jgi:2-polyprenyl-3-methyl-5-hydroxy-6-metoxy-1,4-benzoquinol methylase
VRRWTFADVAAHWDSVAYDESNARIDSHLRRFTDSAPMFSIPSGARVLDIDCRTANGTIFFSGRVPSATFHCVAMAETFRRAALAKLESRSITARVDLLEDLPLSLETASFDVVLSYETVEHVPQPSAFLREIARLLRPGGTLVLTTPNRLWEPVHFLSALLHLDHGEGPHRMLPRHELLEQLRRSGFILTTERTFVLVPAGPSWLLATGRWFEQRLSETIMRRIALRRTLICVRGPGEAT